MLLTEIQVKYYAENTSQHNWHFIYKYIIIMTKGIVKFYNGEKGFGFIEANWEDVFFHITQVVEGYEPTDGDTVSFEISNGRDGRPAAANVSPADAEEGQEEEYTGDEE